jgi:hypothetical protein
LVVVRVIRVPPEHLELQIDDPGSVLAIGDLGCAEAFIAREPVESASTQGIAAVQWAAGVVPLAVFGEQARVFGIFL